MAYEAPKRRRLTHERRVLYLALGSGAPALLVALVLLWSGGYTPKVQWTLTTFLVVIWLTCAFSLRDQVVRPLQTLSNMLAALRESDFSIRGRGATTEDALGLALLEANALGAMLREQRLGALEAAALLRRVMAEIDVAVFAFDDEHRLRLINRHGARVLGRRAEQLLGRSAAELGLESCLAGDVRRTSHIALPGASARWEIRRGEFRQSGRPHQLLLLTDVGATLRAEEREAWQRLVRVLSHEINNSLAPIKSIAGSLHDRLRGWPGGSGTEEFGRGLTVIASRADSLGRFISSYAKLSRLPPPSLRPLEVGPWVRRVAALETRMDVTLRPGPSVTVEADADQLDQLLINLLRNAVDAALPVGGGVEVGWRSDGSTFELVVDDEGPGLADTANLFVPFFTTKENGSGIGLALCRQIAEGHGGNVTVRNRDDHRGVRATLALAL